MHSLTAYNAGKVLSSAARPEMGICQVRRVPIGQQLEQKRWMCWKRLWHVTFEESLDGGGICGQRGGRIDLEHRNGPVARSVHQCP